MSHVKRGSTDRFAEAKTRVALAIETAAEQAARLVQAEVVARVPVRTGKAKAWLASEGALAQLHKGGAWRFGLITPELRKNAHYLYFVEYGTKGYARGSMRVWSVGKDGKRRSKKVKKSVPARPAHPFFRPGVDAARGQVKSLIVQAIKTAIQE